MPKKPQAYLQATSLSIFMRMVVQIADDCMNLSQAEQQKKPCDREGRKGKKGTLKETRLKE